MFFTLKTLCIPEHIACEILIASEGVISEVCIASVCRFQ